MWEDAYGLLRQCQRDMSSDQIITHPNFHLVNAMAAVDVMDLPRENATTRSTFNPYSPITPQELVLIMDKLLIRQMSFQAGQPLAKTLLTCKYLQLKHNRLFLPQIHISFLSVLKVYIITVAKIVDLIWCELRTEVIRENEDVLTLEKGDKIYLAEDESIINILDSLKDSIRWVQEQEDTHSLDHSISYEIRSRLLFRWELLFHMLNFYTNQGITPSFSSCLSVWPDVWEIHNSLQPDLISTESLSNVLREAFDSVSSSDLQSSSSKKTKTFPTVDLLTLEQSKKDVERWIEELDTLCSFIYAPSHSYASFWIFYTSTSSQNPELTVYSRSVYQNKLFSENRFMGERYPTEWLARHYLLECNQNSLAASNEMTINPESGFILNKLSSVLAQHLSMMCDNIPRRRRKLANSVIDWENLWFETIHYNSPISPFFTQETFQRSVNPECIRLKQLEAAIQCILDGFELDLYSPNEQPAMWWLIIKVCDKLETIIYNFQITKTLNKSQTTPTTISTPETNQEQNIPSTYMRLLNLWAKGVRNLSHGIILMSTPKTPLNTDLTNDRLRFERRVKWMPSSWTYSPPSATLASTHAYLHGSPPSSPLSLNALEQLPLFSRASRVIKGLGGGSSNRDEDSESRNTSLPIITWDSFLSFKQDIKRGDKEGSLGCFNDAKDAFTTLVVEQPTNNYYSLFLNIAVENLSRLDHPSDTNITQPSPLDFVSSPWSSFLIDV